MIYRPDGREGRLAYCYVTKPFTCSFHEVCHNAEDRGPATTGTTPHWWASEAHDCTDVRNLVTGRVFNNLKPRFMYRFNENIIIDEKLKLAAFLKKEMYYDNLNESAFTEGIYHATFGKRDFEIQCDRNEWMVCIVTS